MKVLNDFRNVALMSVLMKMLERLVLTYLTSVTNSSMNPLQFPYRENRCTDEAVALALHFVMQHLEAPDRYARILFVDYSSVFNTVTSQNLFDTITLNIGTPQGYVLSHLLYSLFTNDCVPSLLRTTFKVRR